MQYERVNTTDWTGRKRTILLQIIKESEVWLSGWRAYSNGDRSDNMHLIDKATITKRTPMMMNLHYGELEKQE